MSLKYEPASDAASGDERLDHHHASRTKREQLERFAGFYLRILVYLVIYASGQVSLEHLLLSWYPSQRGKT